MLVTGCSSYSKLSNTERIVTYLNFFDKEISYIEKFDIQTNEWFRAECKGLTSSTDSKKCSNNTEFTDLSKIKISYMLENDEKDLNNQNSNSNDSGETSNENENDDSEDEEEEEEEDPEEDWDPNNSGE